MEFMTFDSRSYAVVVAVLLLSGAGLAGASQSPTATFEYSPSDPVAGDTVTFDASGSTDADGEIASYEWDTEGDGDYGDYGEPTGQTAEKTFDSHGTYTVGVRVTDDSGDTDTYTETIRVTNEAPTASFSYTPSDPVAGDTVTFDASGSTDADGEIVSYAWDTEGDGDYGDYGEPTGQTAEKTFDSHGTYTVGLKVTDNGGKTHTVTETVTVTNEAPEPSFSVSPSEPVPDETVTLDASGSTDADGRITSYNWDTEGDGDYGDYGEPTGQTATMSFDTAGTYTVGLEVTDNGGKSKTFSKSVTVTNDAPTATFSFSPSEPAPDEEIALDATDSTDADGQITSYAWDTEGDGDYGDYGEPTGQTASVAFDTAGTYTVGLEVTDNGQESTTVTKQITVTNEPPEPNFTFSPSEPAPDETVTLDASGSTDADGQITSYVWDTNGDGDYGGWGEPTGQTASTAFETAGTYTVGLEVTDNGEETRTVSRTITVSNDAPEPRFDYTVSTDDGLDVRLDASESNDTDGSIHDYSWYVGDRHVASGQTATISFSEKGSYRVRLEVTDNGEKTASTTRTVGVSEPPTAEFSFGSNPVGTGNAVRFDAAESSDPDGRVTDYVWKFEDGRTFRGRTVERTFSDPGTHNVTLTVGDDTGNRVRERKTIRAAVPPEASFEWSPETPKDGMDVVFTGSSPANVTGYEWDFDADGEFEADGNTVSHSFDEVGKHTVSLKVVDGEGVPGVLTRVLTVQKSATFQFTSHRSNVSVGDEAIVTFTVTNRLRNRSLDAKLGLELPPEGASISSVEGGEVVSRKGTDYITVGPGDEQTLRVHVRFNDPGEYDLTGEAVYYFDGRNDSDRRVSEVGPVSVSVDSADEGSVTSEVPGFGIGSALVALLVAALIGRRSPPAGE
ncbi:PKD domain-containing protein [Halorussus marinus]|uniref:PKD domain-containing protein n=1 Tax=Halorussus marinus TaxID=2505976 RepID=UPI00106EDB04|nr:PKD domain-containing protein [Halorussus marinus]